MSIVRIGKWFTGILKDLNKKLAKYKREAHGVMVWFPDKKEVVWIVKIEKRKENEGVIRNGKS